MKITLFACVLFAVTQAKLSADFVTGFETGIFLRDDDKGFNDYNCDIPMSDDAFLKQVNSMIQPMKLMAEMMKD